MVVWAADKSISSATLLTVPAATRFLDIHHMLASRRETAGSSSNDKSATSLPKDMKTVSCLKILLTTLTGNNRIFTAVYSEGKQMHPW